MYYNLWVYVNGKLFGENTFCYSYTYSINFQNTFANTIENNYYHHISSFILPAARILIVIYGNTYYCIVSDKVYPQYYNASYT